MIPKITTGAGGTYGLLTYLYGPGKANEHTDQHMIASWNGFAPDPGPTAEREAITKLARQLDLPVKSLPREQRPKTTIWHCSVRTAANDRPLTDDEWATVARRIVHAAGIAPEGDTKACRWIAVRHAPDHIHIAATLVREDDRTARRNFDKRAVQTEARAIEKDYGLRQLHPGDGTAAKRATSAERRKADLRGLDRPARDQLRDAVRRALAGAATEEEFFHRLTAQGVRITKRVAPSGDVTGFTVALPGDRNRDGKPIWFSGSKLAPDLSLPRIRKRLASTAAPSEGITDPARALRAGTTATADALRSLAKDDDGSAADQLTGIGEVLDALAQTSAAPTRSELQAAARTFERATRSRIQAANTHNQALRKAARDLIQSGPALGKGEDGAATAMLLSVLITAAVMAAHWHAALGHAQQAAAARQTATDLRAAYQAAATTPLATMRATGQTLPAPARHQAAATVQAVLPNEAARIQAEPNWPALAATLTEAAQAGHDPATLLHRAVENRELTTADSLTDVLLWRLRHEANLSAAPLYQAQRPGQRPTPPPTATPVLPSPSYAPTRRR
ncbi:relaxase/mobilization nuclease domain-containing protein [Actinacidiphila bryophytorum]|uniref:Relaxase/Mobilisation nuclease domain-containing protein n=1 Tax=Actinacidiphila bryophytorum TaxID=1436133 RepID=A0A9W4H1M6_9ACTN|nr:relaxase/mobilization nuclease domain-containing protein [Actinacidiphila bryophytorum]MBM9435146.1 mobilization protein [Actinacidiphila bryophytorum]MBN6541526.1 mobilization protein [Actinacidiphila bryophytorum]CAG7643411.1 Relaxase/Mobilisation nuclease domain-containing protein [Actinacidiphila bryophytorum]